MIKLKLIIFFLSITFINSYSQTKATTEIGKQVILNDDGTWQYTNKKKQEVSIPNFTDKTFYWKDGYDKVVQVSFFNLLSDVKGIDKNLFQKMVIKSLTDAKYKLKNKVSFVPRELSFMKDKKGGYIIKVKYLGKNAYGSESENSSFFAYDQNGESSNSY